MRLRNQTYLLIVVGALAIVPVVVFGVLQAQRWSAAERNKIETEVRSRAKTLARELGELINSEAESVERLAGHVEILDSLDPERLQAAVDMHRKRSRYLSFVYIANRAGVSLAVSPAVNADGSANAGVDYSDRGYFTRLMRTGKTTISDVQLGRRSGVPNIQIVAPIHDKQSHIVGFAEVSVDLNALDHAIATIGDHAPGLRIVVTDRRARVLADSAATLPVLERTHTALFAPLGAGLELRSAADEAERSMFGASAAVAARGVGWTVTALRSQSELEARATGARNQAIMVAGLTGLIALVFVVLWASWSSRPVSHLASAASAVGEGDFSQPPPEPRRFESLEMTQLLLAVREMIDRRRTHNADLAQLIAELEQANDQLRLQAACITQAGDAIEICTPEGELEYVNPAWRTLTGHTADEARGDTPEQLLADGHIDDDTFAELSALVGRGRVWRGSFVAQRKDGNNYEVAVSVAPIHDDNGALSHYVVVKRDITDERKAQEVLRINDRMASVGTLAAGVAHEINNPLTYVMANLEFLSDALDQCERSPAIDEARESCAEATIGVERVTEIVRGLKALSRGDEQTVQPIDVHGLLDSCIRMAHNEIRHRATLERDFGDVPPVLANEAQLAQVFINLLINAAHALAVGHRDDSRIVVRTRRAGDQQTAIEVTDTGPGIPPANLSRIFDPFFTTKPVGVGTGLGLSICHSIVTSFGGDIHVDSRVGEGTTFRVVLPASAEAADADADADAATGGHVSARLLVIDDEVLVGKALGRVLDGHRVTLAHSADHALQLLAAEEFDAVLCDVMMPDMSGLELFERVRNDMPGTERRFVFMSGGVFSPDVRDSLSRLAVPFIKKPIRRADVQRVLEQLGA